MKASIIIPAYNEEERIATVIKAALAQDYNDFEVIVVDNASTDRTSEIAKTFPVKVVHEPKKGLLQARECGRVHASGDIIANVDADCLPRTDWLRKGVGYFKDKRIVGVSGPYDYYDGGFFLRAFLWCSFVFRWIFNPLLKLPFINSDSTLVGGNSLIRSSVLQKTGGYDTKASFFGEDTNTSRRISPYGKTVFSLFLPMKTSARRFKSEGVIQLSYKYIATMFTRQHEAWTPIVSLVVCAYNEEKYIGSCLESAIAHSHGMLAEILVVDNASTDSTREVAERYPLVRVVSETSKGLTKARQKGLLEARGDIVLYIDADTELSADWIPKMIKKYQSDERTVCVSGIYRYKEAAVATNIGVWMYWHIFAAVTYLFTRYMVVGGNFAVKKKAMLQIGGFDQTIEFYGEDTDIARRLHTVGKVVFSTRMNVLTSPRRLSEEGIIKTGWIYAKNFFSIVVKGKPATADYIDYR